jgi:hypothetical protein
MAKTPVKNSKQPIIIQNIDIRAPRRQTQDIANWRTALTTAENVTCPKRTLMYDLYDDVKIDARLDAQIGKRKRAVSNSRIVFIENGKENEIITDIAKQPWFRDMLADLLDSRFWGHTLLEFQFGDNISYNLIPRKHVMPEKGMILHEQSDVSGFSYKDAPYSDYVLEAGKPTDFGLIYKAAPYVIYKRGGFGDFAQFCEIFGMPFREAKYDGYDENVRQQLLNMLKEAGSASYAVIPREAEITFHNNTTSGLNTPYPELRRACNEEIDILILGQLLTTSPGENGARSLGEVHMEVEESIHNDDRIFVKNLLNFGFKRLLEIHGYPVGKGEFDYQKSYNMPLKDRILIDEKLNGIVPMDDDYYYETYGVPKPKDYDVQKEKKEKAAQNNPFSFPANNPDPKQDPKNRLSIWDRFFFPGARE